jgi:hypothetical protein
MKYQRFRPSKMNDDHGKIFDLGISQAYSSSVTINNSSSSAYEQLVSPIAGDWITACRIRFIELYSLSAQATPVLGPENGAAPSINLGVEFFIFPLKIATVCRQGDGLSPSNGGVSAYNCECCDKSSHCSLQIYALFLPVQSLSAAQHVIS